MWTRQHKRRNTGRLIIPALAGLFLSYFGFHAYHGEYGLYSSYELDGRLVEAQQVLDDLEATRLRLESRIALLRDGTLEKDMLDEQARSALNLAQDNEVIILLPVR